MTVKRIVSSLPPASYQGAQLHGALEQAPSLPHHLHTLLEWRLTALGINPKDIERYSPRTLANLRSTCALCAHKRRCLEGIMDYGAPPGWAGYCPNAIAIRELSAYSVFAASPVASVGNRRQGV